MATINASNQDYRNNADGWELAGGTTKRKLSLTGGDVTVTGGSSTLTLGGNLTTGSTLTTIGALTTGGALTTAAAFTTSGAYALTLTTTATTNVTLPTSGTLATTSGIEFMQNKRFWLSPGTAGIGGYPLKFSSGLLMSTPEAGAIEFVTDHLYFTTTTGPVRKTIAAYNDASGAAGDIYYRDSSGNFTRLGVGTDTHVLTLVSGLPAWMAPTGGGGSGSPGGLTSHIQYNNAGGFAGSANFTYDPAASPNIHLQSAGDALISMRVQARASQTAHLQSWTDSSFNPMVSVSAAGRLVFSTDTEVYRSTTDTLATGSNFSIKNGKTFQMDGSSSGTVTIQTAAAAGTYTLTLPTTDGSGGEYLKTDGSGVLSWDTPAGGGGGGSAVDSDQNIIAVGVFS